MEPNKMIERKPRAPQLVPRGWEVSIFLLGYVLRVERAI
jgi:hypothetical protein